MRPGGAVVALALSLALHGPAAAQTETRAAVAEALYRQARDLMAAGKYDEACPKFAESQRLDPATGTLLNLAACHEKQGRFATAWLEYSDAQMAARRDAREDRVEYARARAHELEPKLSRLTLSLAPGADDPALNIELDGASVGRAVIGAPTPVDPGRHTVRVSAPGKNPWSASIEIGVTEQQSLVIPPLETAPPEVAAPVPSSTTLATGQPAAGSAARDALAPRPIPSSVYVAGGVTLALAVGAGVSGVAYLNKREDYQEPKDDSDAVDRRRSALRYGYLNAGMWAATAVSASVTTYLYLTRPEQAPSAATRVVPWAAPQSAGLSVTGGF
jgi:tetratricopeptide (TPR) repeat protein